MSNNAFLLLKPIAKIIICCIIFAYVFQTAVTIKSNEKHEWDRV